MGRGDVLTDSRLEAAVSFVADYINDPANAEFVVRGVLAHVNAADELRDQIKDRMQRSASRLMDMM
jgi:hypothetical protein